MSSAALDNKIDFIVWFPPVTFFLACVLAAFVEFHGLSAYAQQNCLKAHLSVLFCNTIVIRFHSAMENLTQLAFGSGPTGVVLTKNRENTPSVNDELRLKGKLSLI